MNSLHLVNLMLGFTVSVVKKIVNIHMFFRDKQTAGVFYIVLSNATFIADLLWLIQKIKKILV